MGKESATDKDSVIIFRRGKEQMISHGPGGYKIEWSHGTKIVPLEQAPSGHLVFTCDNYSKVKSPEQTENIVLITDHTCKGQPQA